MVNLLKGFLYYVSVDCNKTGKIWVTLVVQVNASEHENQTILEYEIFINVFGKVSGFILLNLYKW